MSSSISGIKNAPSTPDSLSGRTKAAMKSGLPKRTAMSKTVKPKSMVEVK